MNNDIDLRGLQDKGIKGFIRFTVKADDTTDNEEVHKRFKELARTACGNDYTLTIRMLLDYFDDRGAFEMMWEKVKELETEISEIRALAEKKVLIKDEGGAF
jgi:hypothetical protein